MSKKEDKKQYTIYFSYMLEFLAIRRTFQKSL